MIKNISGKPLPILRWTLLPDGRAVARFTGKIQDLPVSAVQSPQARRLADEGLVEIEGYTPAPKAATPPPPAAEVKRRRKDEPEK